MKTVKNEYRAPFHSVYKLIKNERRVSTKFDKIFTRGRVFRRRWKFSNFQSFRRTPYWSTVLKTYGNTIHLYGTTDLIEKKKKNLVRWLRDRREVILISLTYRSLQMRSSWTLLTGSTCVTWKLIVIMWCEPRRKNGTNETFFAETSPYFENWHRNDTRKRRTHFTLFRRRGVIN